MSTDKRAGLKNRTTRPALAQRSIDDHLAGAAGITCKRYYGDMLERVFQFFFYGEAIFPTVILVAVAVLLSALALLVHAIERSTRAKRFNSLPLWLAGVTVTALMFVGGICWALRPQ